MKLLNMLIEEYGNNLIRFFETLKPLLVVLQPPLAESSIEDIVKLVEFSPTTLILIHTRCMLNFLIS